MTEPIPHEDLMACERAATVVLWPALAEEGEEPRSLEEFAHTVRGLVWEVQRLRQQIAIRKQEDRIAEQIEKGFR